MIGLRRPPRLKPGDRVAVVAPGGPVDRALLSAGGEILRTWGLDVTCAPHVTDRHGVLPYLAGRDADRAQDLQQAWLDPSITAVLCARGGYGAQRVIDLLDWTAMSQAEPKVFAGSSNITAVHEAFGATLGVATLFAPMVGNTALVTDPATRGCLRRTLFDPESVRRLTSPAAGSLIGGCARGVTVGGTATLLAASRGARLTNRATS